MTKITDLAAASTPLDPTDLVEVVQDVGGTPINKKVPVSDLASTAISGTYTGTGVAWDTVLTLPRACSSIFVRGHPSQEVSGTTFGHEAHAVAGAGKAIRWYYDGGGLGFPSEQLELAADGVTVTADGTGANGLNEAGSTYNYVAF